MSKKLFAALSLSVLLAACQGNVTTDDTMMEDTSSSAMMEDTSSAMMDESSSSVEAMDESSSSVDGMSASVGVETSVSAE